MGTHKAPEMIYQRDAIDPNHVQVYLSDGVFSDASDVQQRLDTIFCEIAALNPKVVVVNDTSDCIGGGAEAWAAAVQKHIPADVVMVYERSSLAILLYYSPAPVRRPNDIFFDHYAGA